MLLGGGRISYYLAKMIVPAGLHVAIIEIKPDKAADLSEQLPHVNVILGDGTDQELLEQEGLDQMDAFVALCDRDEENLITGTRYMNVDGMLPFENLVADYVKETDNHVLYRVTPVFEGQNLVASGVQMEAWSVEDEGEGVCFNVYVYNVQPGITIDYATGESWQEGAEPQSGETTYILNTNSHKFHDPDCSSVSGMSTANRQEYTGSREDLIAQGYTPCGQCNP